jgi:hypothetical protein
MKYIRLILDRSHTTPITSITSSLYKDPSYVDFVGLTDTDADEVYLDLEMF